LAARRSALATAAVLGGCGSGASIVPNSSVPDAGQNDVEPGDAPVDAETMPTPKVTPRRRCFRDPEDSDAHEDAAIRPRV